MDMDHARVCVYYSMDRGRLTRRGDGMLVLSREQGTGVWICDGRIKVTVLSIVGGRVKLGFQADRDILIDRNEVAEKKHRFRGELVAGTKREH